MSSAWATTQPRSGDSRATSSLPRSADLAATVASVSGREVSAVEVPPERLTEIRVGAGVPEGYAEVLTSADEGIAPGELEVTTGDLERLIGRPPTTLREAVTEALAA